MRLSARHRRFLWLDQGLIPAAVNFIIVGGIAWAMFGSQPELPKFGMTSVASELLATGFLLPLITCLINSPIVRSQVKSGKLPPLNETQMPKRQWYKQRSYLRGIVLGLPGLLFATATIPLVLVLWPGETLETQTFILFKAVWAAVFGFAITPLIGWWALANASEPLAD